MTEFEQLVLKQLDILRKEVSELKKAPEIKELNTVAETSKILTMHPNTIYRKCCTGELKRVGQGGGMRITGESIRNYGKNKYNS